MAKRKKRDGQSETKWRRMVREQGQNGLSIREFCRRSKLHESAFYFWRRELERRDVARREAEQSKRPSTQATFVPIRVAEDVRPDATGIEIVLLNGHRIHVVAPVDRQALTDVLAVLAAASPERLEARPC
jgi:transposase-like protein